DKLGAAVDENIFVPDGRHAVSAGCDRDRLAMVFIVTDGGIMAFREREERVLHTCLIIFHGPGREISDKEVGVRMPGFLEHNASCGLTRTSDALTSYIRCSFGPKRLKIQRPQTRNRASCNQSPTIELDSYIRCSLTPKYSYIGCSYFVHQM